MEFIVSDFTFNLFFILLFIVNLFMTYYILKKSKNLLYRLLSILIIWIFPIFGILLFFAVDKLLIDKFKPENNVA